MRLPGGRQLGYCTNVHAGESAAEVVDSLRRVAAPVRERLEVQALGLGLYLSHRAAGEVDPPRLRDELTTLGLYAFTFNGFPYGGFHAGRVKEAVYRPDWTDPLRAAHTLRLASILEAIAPPDVTAPTISTLPLGWRIGWTHDQTAAAARALVSVARELRERVARGGRPIRICLEPEPGCILETTQDAVRFFQGPIAREAGRDLDAVHAHLGVCYDFCHQAVAFENPKDVVGQLTSAGVAIGKVQVSSALELRDPADAAALARLAAFDEPRYLHQTRARDGGGYCDDLPEALQRLPRDRPWRVHFHSPIDRDVAGPLGTTRADLQLALEQLRSGTVTSQFEVETYTWSVLPEAERPADDAALATGLAREVASARNALL
jgi:sugar phosphate isomerase/epimerase